MKATSLILGTAAGLLSSVSAGLASEPVLASLPANVQTARPLTCKESLDAAVVAIREEAFDAALDLVSKGLQQCPNDLSHHELRALILFAKGNYQEASASVHISMAGRPAWNWSTVGRLYPNVGTYTAHLRALEAFARKHPDDSAARFLLAYHYVVIGYPDSALRELEMVVRLDGSDRIAAELLKSLPKAPVAPAPATSLRRPGS